MRRFPHVVAFAIQTSDGFIALHRGHSTVEWRSGADARFLTERLDDLGEAGVIVVGNTTYHEVIDRLSKRNCIVFTRSVSTVKRVHETLLLCNPEGVSLASILEDYDKVALLGGTQVYTYFFDRDLIDELYLTIEPVDFGDGLTLLERPRHINAKLRVESSQSMNEEGTFLRHYERRTL
jgi:dihydrofolate reductase